MCFHFRLKYLHIRGAYRGNARLGSPKLSPSEDAFTHQSSYHMLFAYIFHNRHSSYMSDSQFVSIYEMMHFIGRFLVINQRPADPYLVRLSALL